MEVRERQYWKASFPILVTPLGIVTDTTLGRQSKTVLSFINKPSTSSASIIVAPQLLDDVQALLLMNLSEVNRQL